MKKIVSPILGALLAVSLMLTGCGSQTTTTQSATSKQAEKTLIEGRGGDSVSLDPINVTDGQSMRVTGNIFDTLVAYKPTNMEAIPALATEWKVSPDGKVWTFTLRDGVKFHDGTDFNADAVVFNFQRWMDKSNPYHTGGNFDYFQIMFGGFKGDKGCVISDVKALDKNHVQFSLTVPQAPFLANIEMVTFGIASPDAVKKYGDKFGQHPVGTGPFVFQEWKPNDMISLTKNKDFWQKGFPKLDKLIFRVIPDNTARLTALQSGEIDLLDGLNPSDAATITSNSKLQLFKRPPNNVGYLSFNNLKPPFDKVKVRQALSMAINKQGLVDAFYNGMAMPAKNALPPSIWGYNDKVQDYQYNLDAAKKLLAEAGYPNGFETELWVSPVSQNYMPQPQKVAESIQADFAKIGVKAKIVSMEWATYLKKTSNGEHPMALLGWTGDNGDPDNFLYVLLDKDNANPPAASNISLYKNDRVHELLIKAQTTPDQQVRSDLYKQAEQIIHDDAPMVPLVHSTPLLAGANYVKGFVPYPTSSDRFTEVSIEK
ncbi:MAG: ABC transporter substrate-binding protein [Desulfitobacteriaceae bacterium]